MHLDSLQHRNISVLFPSLLSLPTMHFQARRICYHRYNLPNSWFFWGDRQARPMKKWCSPVKDSRGTVVVIKHRRHFALWRKQENKLTALIFPKPKLFTFSTYSFVVFVELFVRMSTRFCCKCTELNVRRLSSALSSTPSAGVVFESFSSQTY